MKVIALNQHLTAFTTTADLSARIAGLLPVPDNATPEKTYAVHAARLLHLAGALPPGAAYANGLTDSSVSATLAAMERHVSQPLCNRAATIGSFIRQQSAQGSPDTCNAILYLVLKAFLEKVNIARHPSVTQVSDMVSVTVSEFADLSVSDVVLCLRDIRTGKHGGLYENFSVEKLGIALRAHRESKAESVENEHLARKQENPSVLAMIVNHAPDALKRELMHSASGIGSGHPDRQLPTVDNMAAFADKPKPMYRKSPAPTEAVFTDRIKGNLSAVMHTWTAAQFDDAIDYYRSECADVLAGWVECQKEKHQPK